MCPCCEYTEARGAKPFRIVVRFEISDAWLFGLTVVDLGNSRKKSVSPGQLSRNPIELRSEAGSGVVALGVVSGLDAAADVRLCQPHEYYMYSRSPIPLHGPVAPEGRLFTHFLPNSTHFRQGKLLSHLTFNLEHSSHACRLRPLSNEEGIAEEPRRSQRLKWSRRTSL
jgi:hypothetical protein